MRYRPALSVVKQLVGVASDVTGYSPEDITGPRRFAPLCEVRYAIMTVARACGLSMPQIGAGLAYRDHTTVLNGLRRAEVLGADPEFSQLVSDLRGSLERAA